MKIHYVIKTTKKQKNSFFLSKFYANHVLYSTSQSQTRRP